MIFFFFFIKSSTVKPVLRDHPLFRDHPLLREHLKMSQLIINYLEYTSFERPPIMKDHIWFANRGGL